MNSGPHPDLIVESGLHQAARCAIPARRSRIGSGPDAEIVVSDLAAEFALEPTKDGFVLCASKMPIEVRGQRSIKPGRARRCTGATHFSCGGIAFRIDMPSIDLPREALPIRKQRLGLAVRIFGFAGGMAVTAMVSAIALSRAMPFTQAPTKALAGTISSVGASSPRRPGTDTLLLETALRRHLDANGLESVATTVQSDGSIEATGEITPAGETAWRSTGRWFDTVAKGRVVLVDAVRTVEIAPPLTVAAVWAGSNPYVVDGDGDRLFVGSILATGWTIDSIDTRHVTLRRAGRTLAVRF